VNYFETSPNGSGTNEQRREKETMGLERKVKEEKIRKDITGGLTKKPLGFRKKKTTDSAVLLTQRKSASLPVIGNAGGIAAENKNQAKRTREGVAVSTEKKGED